jgi:hypothetical protein
MASAATRREKNLGQKKCKRILLTPTGLLMEGDFTHNRLVMSVIGIFASSAFLRQIVKVIARIRMDVSKCEAVISEDASVIVDAEGKIAEHHAIHRVLFAVEAVYVSGREKERRTGLEDA